MTQSTRRKPCSVEACGKPEHARGWCGKHYQRWRTHGDPRSTFTPSPTCDMAGCGAARVRKRRYCQPHIRAAVKAKAIAEGRACKAPGCEAWPETKGMCRAHNYRMGRYGTFDKLVRNLGESEVLPGYVRTRNTQGYIHLVKIGDAYDRVLEHRALMERKIGRPLRPEETVHHVNGVRDDNRLENLELWSSSHPGGQRVQDKVAWAREILALYTDPDATFI